jgi:hypothetical protein
MVLHDEQRLFDSGGDPDALLREQDAARLVGFTPRALQEWRRLKKGPAYVRVGSRAVRYRRRDLVAWANALRIAPTGGQESPRRGNSE